MEAWECPTCHSINPDNGRCSTCTSAAALCYSVYRGDPSGDGSSAAAKASSHPLAHLNAAPKVTPTPAPPAAPPRLGMWGHVRGYLPGSRKGSKEAIPEPSRPAPSSATSESLGLVEGTTVYGTPEVIAAPKVPPVPPVVVAGAGTPAVLTTVYGTPIRA